MSDQRSAVSDQQESQFCSQMSESTFRVTMANGVANATSDLRSG